MTKTLMGILGWLLGLENVQSIERADVSLTARWAASGPGTFWVVLAAAVIIALVLAFYFRFQPARSRLAQGVLAACRATMLVTLLLTLANPVLQLTIIHIQPPLVQLLFDGTESMAIEDRWSEPQRQQLADAVGLDAAMSGDGRALPELSRTEYLQALVAKTHDNLVSRLVDEKGYRVEAYVFDGNTTSQLRRLRLRSPGSRQVDLRLLARQLSTNGQVTALGSVLADASQQPGRGNLAAVLLFSDFAHNSGVHPLVRRDQVADAPATRLGVPVYTIGVGAAEAADLSLDMHTEPKMRRGDRTVIKVRIQQTGLSGKETTLRVQTRRLGDPRAATATAEVGSQTVTLTEDVQLVEFPFTPPDAGDFRFTAIADPVEGEAVPQNNRAQRVAKVIDDYVRLMYVAHEPSWEWRFVKEVFHRDPTVGMNGFRTYLASSDPRVRETNPLFLPTLTPSRSEFFANDVIFLDDMPRGALTDRFCEMVEQYVGTLGGGLVVITGPRFGPKELLGTPLADMLPVRIAPEKTIRDDKEFQLRLTPASRLYSFMQLGDSDEENDKAWTNLGPLPWYYPAAQVHPRAEVLAEHPSETCDDGRTHQPLIAIRRYGEGEVVYLAFNEMWRLRRGYGEKYYRRFWSPLIDRLGLSHALGNDKRFTLRLAPEQAQYRVDDVVRLTVQAYDEDFEPLAESRLPQSSLECQLLAPGDDRSGPGRALRVGFVRGGIFEAHLPLPTAGRYTIRVQDPISGRIVEREMEVAGESAERRVALRDEQLQHEIASATRGLSYTLADVSHLPDELQLEPVRLTASRSRALWATPLWFGLLVGLMLAEWLIRKLVRLS